MDNKLARYRTIITQILQSYAKIPYSNPNINPQDELEEQLILDTQNDHYQILAIGWEGAQRVYYPVFHIDIKNDKVWIQEDATDSDLVGQLEEQGVEKSDIVLAFQAPYNRPYTGYAVA
jgi:XisI protein